MSNEGCGPAPAPAIGQSFDEVVLPHLNAAYRLARWRLRHEQDAEDVVQEALLRAFRYFGTFTGGNGRAWFLRIVRNTSCGWRARELRSSVTHGTTRPKHFNPHGSGHFSTPQTDGFSARHLC